MAELRALLGEGSEACLGGEEVLRVSSWLAAASLAYWSLWRSASAVGYVGVVGEACGWVQLKSNEALNKLGCRSSVPLKE